MQVSSKAMLVSRPAKLGCSGIPPVAVFVATNRVIRLVVDLVRATFKPKAELVIENLALRQLVAVLKTKRPRPKLSDADRLFWVVLRK